MVYFMQRGSRGPIKIGYSLDPEARRRRVQKGWDEFVALTAIIPGGIGVERALHKRFAAGRLEGEWFDDETPGLDDFISDARHFEGFWPEDKESPAIRDVLALMFEAGFEPPEVAYMDGWA